jgi:two-component system, cell cycle sensor histidine kinase and response regulator CckA
MLPTPFFACTAGLCARPGIAGVVVADGEFVRLLGDFSSSMWLRLGLVLVAAMLLYSFLHWAGSRSRAIPAPHDGRWKAALEAMGHGVWEWDGESREVYYSKSWKEILGHADAEIGSGIGEWTSRIHPDDRALVRHHFRQHYLGKTSVYVCEHRLCTKAGNYIWVIARGHIVSRGPNGRPRRALGTHVDITARKNAEARMVDALRLNETILRVAPVGIATFGGDGQTLSANESVARFVGAETSELLRQNFRHSESWRQFGLVEVADRALQGNAMIAASQQFTPAFGQLRSCELKLTPFDYDGQRRLLLMVRDTTEQRAGAEQLEILHAALDAAPTGWIVTNVDGVIEWVNPAFTKLTGYSREEVIGRTPRILKSDRHSPTFYADLWRTIRNGDVWHGEICNRRKNGSVYYERATVAPVRDSAGAISHFVAMKEDITGQHELEQQLARGQRLESIGALASGIAHDLNNILAPILLAVNVVRERHADPETREMLDLIRGAAQRGASVVKQVLTFARGADGQYVTLDIRPLIEELAQFARETFPRAVRISADLPPTTLLVEGDATPLHQVLLNLAVNARDAMPDGGALAFRADAITLAPSDARRLPGGKPGQYVKMTVTDTGTGMPPEVLEHIFEPFFTTKPRGKGTGLGLSAVYGIVRGLGGFVDVASVVGKGSEFSVFLPVSPQREVNRKDRAKALTPVVGGGRQILIVDDEESIRTVISHVLARRGFVPVVAADGLQALAALRSNHSRFHAAIVDLMMPGMDGYAVIREMLRMARELPIIVVSGMMGRPSDPEDRSSSGTFGAKVVLKKPFTEVELLEALESATRPDASDRRPTGNAGDSPAINGTRRVE